MFPLTIKSFEALFKEHYHFLLLVSFQIVRDDEVSKDIVQDFFINLWEKREANEIREFKSYSTRAVKNLSISYIRKVVSLQVNQHAYTEELIDDVEPDSITLQADLEFEEDANSKVDQLLSLLPQKRKDIFVSYVVDGLTYEEIAQKYQLSINTVKTQMQRSYKFLKVHAKSDKLNSIFLSIIFSNYLNQYRRTPCLDIDLRLYFLLFRLKVKYWNYIHLSFQLLDSMI